VAALARPMHAASDTEADYGYPSPAKFSDSDTETVHDSGYATGASAQQKKSSGDAPSSSSAASTSAGPASREPKGGRHADDDWNYVRRTIAKEKPLPPITLKTLPQNINWVSFLALTVVPALAFYGAATTKLQWQTAVWCVVYYFYTGLGITAGYHRLWAHRAYSAGLPLQYFLALGGSGAVEGSIRWWSRGHRAHHRYTDTDLDPYSAHKGFWWSHIGWMIFKGRRAPGVADVSDLSANPVVRWQHRWYLPLIFGMGFVFPTAVAGLLWGDWRGGFFFAGAARLLFVHHSTFCVNSLAHWLGETPFDDKHTPRDHWITALVTVGEGYHNFHHQFPMDYRNATHWNGYDPTKWFIWLSYKMGLAYNLKTFPQNEIAKGQYAMQLKKVEAKAATVVWPKDSNDLPILTWEEFQEQHKNSGRKLMVIGGFIHDVTEFEADHPGGASLVKYKLGKDATTSFNGGVYEHSNAAHNLLSMLRVGALHGGYEVEAEKNRPFPGLTIFDGPSLRAEATQKLPRSEKAKKQAVVSSLPSPLTVAA